VTLDHSGISKRIALHVQHLIG